MVKEVQGVYNNIDEALEKVESLNKRGYHEKDIVILANRDVEKDLPWNVDASTASANEANVEQDKGFWESIKSAFVVDDVEDTNYRDDLVTVRDSHRADLDSGKILVLVDSEADVNRGDYNDNENFAYTGDELRRGEADDHLDVDPRTGVAPGAAAGTGVGNTFGSDNPAHDNADRQNRIDSSNETLDLKEEKVHVDKEERETGDVEVGKRVVEEKQTVEVPVQREEVTIRRKPVDGKKSTTGIREDEEEIVIPTKKERVNVSKETEVVEEVEIDKEVHTDTETVEETVRHEELDVKGNANELNRDKSTGRGELDDLDDLDHKKPSDDPRV